MSCSRSRTAARAVLGFVVDKCTEETMQNQQKVRYSELIAGCFTPEQARLVKTAAAEEERTISQFVRRAVLREAERHQERRQSEAV